MFDDVNNSTASKTHKSVQADIPGTWLFSSKQKLFLKGNILTSVLEFLGVLIVCLLLWLYDKHPMMFSTCCAVLYSILPNFFESL